MKKTRKRTAQETAAGQRLWDGEPSLGELARQVVATKAIPQGWPQPEGLWCSPSGAAVNLGTPRLKIGLWGPPESLTLSLAKTDVWDRRRGWELPLTLEEIRRGAFDPANAPAPGHKVPLRGEDGYPRPGGGRSERYASWAAYPFPCPKPVGQVIVRCADFDGIETPQAEVRYDGSPAQVRLRRGNTELAISYLAMMDRNLIGIGLRGVRLGQSVLLRLYRHRDTVGRFGTVEEPGVQGYDYSKDTGWNGPLAPPEPGSADRFFWIRQRFPPEKTFPHGFEYVMMALVPACATIKLTRDGFGLGTPVVVPDEVRRGQFGKLLPTCEKENAAAGAAADAIFPPLENLDATVWLTVVTSAEADDPAAEARRQLLDAERRAFAHLARENGGWYQRFYQKREDGRIFGNDPDWARQQIPNLAASWRIADGWLSHPDPTRFEADETYAFLNADRHPWHGLPCFNEIYFTAEAVRNRCDRLRYYAQLIQHWLEAARQNAREVFGLPGMMIAHGYLPPIRADAYAHVISTWEFCMEIPAQVLKPVWDTWDYEGNEELLADVLYPALRDLAVFYAAFVTKESDGRYHVAPTVSAEHWAWTWRFERNRDSTSALSMIAWTLKSAADAAEWLHRDTDLQVGWRRLAGELASYPIWKTKEGIIYGDVAGVDPTAQGYNFFPGVIPTVLADQITLDSPRDQIDAMVRTALSTGGWLNQDVFHLLGAFPDRIKGVPPAEFTAAKNDVLLDEPVKQLNAFERKPERLLNSRGGSIHLFPCVPPGCTVAFRRFQARGGFLVSAEMRNGKVTCVCIEARRSVPCRLINPWPGATPLVTESSANGSDVHRLRPSGSGCLLWTAQRGKTYIVAVPESGNPS